jgi:hypothetical protein
MTARSLPTSRRQGCSSAKKAGVGIATLEVPAQTRTCNLAQIHALAIGRVPALGLFQLFRAQSLWQHEPAGRNLERRRLEAGNVRVPWIGA